MALQKIDREKAKHNFKVAPRKVPALVGVIMSLPIFSWGGGKRAQFAQREDGFWFKRIKDHRGMWAKWVTTGSKVRPDNLWYNPSAGRANLPKE